MRKPQAYLRLFCFPYAGGGATIFHSWTKYLPAEIEVCAVQLPGRENRLLEPPISYLPALISALAPAVLDYLDRPYAFFGHSMGALIAFELSRYLWRLGYRDGPLCLFLSGCRAPQLPDPTMPTHLLPDVEFIEKLRRLKGTSEEILNNEELLRLFMPILRADFALCETYRYQQEAPLPYPITALGGLQDHEIPREAILAWKEQTSSTFKTYFFESDHFFLHREQEKLLYVLTQGLLKDLGNTRYSF